VTDVPETQHLGALRDAALVVVRAATDTGQRYSLDDTITAFGFDRAELEAELETDLTASSIGTSAEPEPAEPLPAWLVTALTTTVGLSPEVVAAMTHTEAMARLQAHWSTP